MGLLTALLLLFGSGNVRAFVIQVMIISQSSGDPAVLLGLGWDFEHEQEQEPGGCLGLGERMRRFGSGGAPAHAKRARPTERADAEDGVSYGGPSGDSEDPQPAA